MWWGRTWKHVIGCMLGYEKVGWLNNPVEDEEGCGRMGYEKVGWLNNPV